MLRGGEQFLYFNLLESEEASWAYFWKRGEKKEGEGKDGIEALDERLTRSNLAGNDDVPLRFDREAVDSGIKPPLFPSTAGWTGVKLPVNSLSRSAW